MMIFEGRKKITLILTLFWVMALSAAYLIHETYGLDLHWYTVLISLFLTVFGLTLSYGSGTLLSLLLFPFIWSKEDLLRYDVKKASIFMGAMYVAFSCTLIFVSMGRSVFWAILIVAAAVEIGAVYVIAAKRFKADIRPRY